MAAVLLQVLRCPTTHREHDWKNCSFSHEGEKVARRDLHVHWYQGVMCENVKADEVGRGTCSRCGLAPLAPLAERMNWVTLVLLVPLVVPLVLLVMVAVYRSAGPMRARAKPRTTAC
jgi:hypothetical protein